MVVGSSWGLWVTLGSSVEALGASGELWAALGDSGELWGSSGGAPGDFGALGGARGGLGRTPERCRGFRGPLECSSEALGALGALTGL